MIAGGVIFFVRYSVLSILLIVVYRVTLNRQQPNSLLGFVRVDLDRFVEDSGLDLVGFVLDLDYGRRARHYGLAREGYRHTRTRLGDLLDHQRLVAIIHEAELLDQIASTTLHITKVVRGVIEGHTGPARLCRSRSNTTERKQKDV